MLISVFFCFPFLFIYFFLFSLSSSLSGDVQISSTVTLIYIPLIAGFLCCGTDFSVGRRQNTSIRVGFCEAQKRVCQPLVMGIIYSRKCIIHFSEGMKEKGWSKLSFEDCGNVIYIFWSSILKNSKLYIVYISLCATFICGITYCIYHK